jgi:predicted DNA-binding transcriptional regulator AlpA
MASGNTVWREPLVKAAAVAKHLDTSVNQLTRLRYEGKGPQYIKLGRSVRYRWADVDAWVQAQEKATAGGAT